MDTEVLSFYNLSLGKDPQPAAGDSQLFLTEQCPRP